MDPKTQCSAAVTPILLLFIHTWCERCADV